MKARVFSKLCNFFETSRHNGPVGVLNPCVLYDNFSPMKIPRKLLLFRVAALAAGLTVGLLLAEGLTRVFHPKPPIALRYFDLEEEERGLFCRYSPQLGWEGIPGA